MDPAPFRFPQGAEKVDVVFHVLATLATIILLGQLLGRVLRWFGQPPVIGEVVSGILLGRGDLAEDIIDKMTGEFEPEQFQDRYENAMIELIRSKQAGLPAPKEKPTARPANVVNLMDALRRSVEGETGKAKPAKAAPAKKAEPAARPRRKAAKG